jgi:hypothetical protein
VPGAAVGLQLGGLLDVIHFIRVDTILSHDRAVAGSVAGSVARSLSRFAARSVEISLERSFESSFERSFESSFETSLSPAGIIRNLVIP